jgi:hypothetical protein
VGIYDISTSIQPRLNLTERQARIAEMVRQHDFVSMERLAASFQVTTQTIRRDLTLLCDAGCSVVSATTIQIERKSCMPTRAPGEKTITIHQYLIITGYWPYQKEFYFKACPEGLSANWSYFHQYFYFCDMFAIQKRLFI